MRQGGVLPRLVLGLLLAAVAYGIAPAEEIQLGTAPSNPAKAGFRMIVYSERLGNEGFQPLTLRFLAIGKSFNRQRRLRVVFRPRTQYATEIDFQFSSDVVVPEGVKQHDVPILVPHFYRWESCSVRIYEDGRQWGRFPSPLGLPMAVKDWGQVMSVGIVVPRDATSSKEPWAVFPDMRTIVTVQGNGPISEKTDVPRLSSAAARDHVESIQSGWARFRILDEDTMQGSWLGYSQLDLIVAPYPVLERIEREQPDKMEAIRDWVAAGGQIWTYAAAGRMPAKGSFFRGALANINKQVKFYSDVRPQLMLSENNDNAPIQYQPYNYGTYYSSAYSYGNADKSRRDVYQKLVSAKSPMVATLTRKQLTGGLDAMAYGLGRVVYLDADDPFPGSFQLWKSLQTDREGWNQRNGVDYSTGSDSYWAWLMPSVGQPPVTAFVILNGLFVLIMGPVLYFTLRRRARLYLLYFIAPTLAFLATMGLFTYAFLSDGFDNRARVRQLTWYDGLQALPADDPSKEVMYPILDQSRQTYYTVVDSRQGLNFSGSDLVLPVHHSELINTYNYYPADDSRSGDYQIERTGEGWRYEGSFLPTRTQVHYLVTRPAQGALPITASLVDGKMTVVNHLASPLSEVCVRDASGKYWWTDQPIAPSGSGVLENSRASPFLSLAERLVDPDNSQMPAPYQTRTSSGDRTAAEDRILDHARNPVAGSFMAITEVDPERFALRQCSEDECHRLIGGYLP